MAYVPDVIAGIDYGKIRRPKGSQDADLQQGPVEDGYPLIVEDLGTHTNPRRYEKDNGFTSARVARAGGVATALWAVGTAAVYPVAGRTAGKVTTIYTLVIENNTGAAATAWLEVGAAAITPDYHINNGDTVVVPFIAGMTIGNVDVNLNASVNMVVAQLIGTEATV